MNNVTGRLLNTMAQVQCSSCSEMVEVTFEQLADHFSNPIVCTTCAADTSRSASAPKDLQYHVAVMTCRECNSTRVLLSPAEAQELCEKRRQPLCGICFVNVVGPARARQAEREGNDKLARDLRKQIVEAKINIEMLLLSSLGQKLTRETAEVIRSAEHAKEGGNA